MADELQPAGQPVPDGERTDGPQDERLDGWKAIAGYLARDIRTVQRWELNERLPIHRLEHKQRATAYAFTSELDAWLAQRSPHDTVAEAATEGPPTGGRRKWALATVVVGLAAIAIGLVAFRPWVGRPTIEAGDTRDPQAYAAFAEGSALYGARQYRDAAIALERAVSRDASYGVAWALLGKTYGRLSQPMWAGGNAASDRATEAARRAAQLLPRHPETHVALSLAARARSDVQTWRAEARRALELDPRAAEAMALLGDSYSAYVYSCNRDQDPGRAEQFYRQALELKPNLSTAVSNRAHNLRRMGRYAECVDLMNRTIRAFPDATPMMAERGACRLLAGDAAGAAEDIVPLRNNPKIAPAGALVYLGLLELKTGQTENGIRDLEAVLQLDQSARAELIVAETYGISGQLAHAVTHLQRAFDLDRSCAGMVATSVAFTPVRQTDEVKALLAKFGVH